MIHNGNQEAAKSGASPIVRYLAELGKAEPVTLLGNVTRHFAERLRRANREITALE